MYYSYGYSIIIVSHSAALEAHAKAGDAAAAGGLHGEMVAARRRGGFLIGGGISLVQ